jgi:hypothetical protein
MFILVYIFDGLKLRRKGWTSKWKTDWFLVYIFRDDLLDED